MYKIICASIILTTFLAVSEARGLYRHNTDSSEDMESRNQLQHLDPKILRYLLKEMTSEDANGEMDYPQEIDGYYPAGAAIDPHAAAQSGYYYMNTPEYLERGAGYAPIAPSRRYLSRGGSSHHSAQVKRSRSARSLKRDTEFLGHKRDIRTPEEAYNEWILANLG